MVPGSDGFYWKKTATNTFLAFPSPSHQALLPANFPPTWLGNFQQWNKTHQCGLVLFKESVWRYVCHWNFPILWGCSNFNKVMSMFEGLLFFFKFSHLKDVSSSTNIKVGWWLCAHQSWKKMSAVVRMESNIFPLNNWNHHLYYEVHPRKPTWIPKIAIFESGDTFSKAHHFWYLWQISGV